jgi:hypothetical protein
MNSTQSSTPCGNVRTGSISWSRRKIGQHAGFKQSPQTFSRGKTSRSRSSVCRPALAQKAAQLAPAGPLPTIATSNMPYCRGEQGAPQGAAIFNRRCFGVGGFKPPLLEAFHDSAQQ